MHPSARTCLCKRADLPHRYHALTLWTRPFVSMRCRTPWPATASLRSSTPTRACSSLARAFWRRWKAAASGSAWTAVNQHPTGLSAVSGAGDHEEPSASGCYRSGISRSVPPITLCKAAATEEVKFQAISMACSWPLDPGCTENRGEPK